MTAPKGREGSILAVVVDEATNSIVFNVKGAAPDGGAKSITFDMNKASPENRAYAALHGFNQRLRDAGALSSDPKTGKAAPPADKFAAIERLIVHYESGSADWHLRQAGERAIGGEMALLVRAILAAKPSADPENVRAKVKSWSAGDRLKVANSAEIKPFLEALKAEMVSEIDVEAQLAELG